jgi:F420-dependent oxidoreductase-like protein
MLAISIQIEAQGFAGLFRSDHFTNARPPDKDSLEMVVSLTYLADHSQHVHFGPLVAPLSFRDPTLLARQAAALDDLSSGRMILGLGAGWQEREHRLFGHDLGDVPTRMTRLEEGLEVITRLFKSDEPVTFEGRFYQLREAILLPRPQRRGGPPILLGGTGLKRTLPLVARYANAWNAVYLPPQEFRKLSTYLDGLLQQARRAPSEVQRSIMLELTFGQTMDEVERKLRRRHAQSAFENKSLDAVIEEITGRGDAVVGTPKMAIAQIQTYAGAGVDELIFQWFDMEDIDGLRAFAEQVLPFVSSAQ